MTERLTVREEQFKKAYEEMAEINLSIAEDFFTLECEVREEC